ncbi:methyltransferase [Microbacterium sp. X-17]|uniref:DUF7059 domain-containing protein n=1 Tax=Microbacterium sp. X-17 TaxID=3144404 RepID=UPI0031F53BDB
MESVPSLTPALAQALAADLDAAGYREERLSELWGRSAFAALRAGDAAAARWRAGADPASVMARLLWWGETVPAEEAERAFPRTGVDGLVAAGCAVRTEGGVRATLTLRPVPYRDERGSGEWWIASDLDEVAGIAPLPPEHVLGVGGASRTLAALLPPGEVDRALDLGCGCGILSLHASRRSRVVVATDVSARALAFTEFNARLNGVTNIETRRGSLYEPVAGERFGLIAANPPFVVTPRAEGVPVFEYRDGGEVGDALMRRVIEGLGAHLEPGGMAVVLGNWEYRSGAAGLEAARSWLEGLDAWVIERERLDPVEYARLWVRDGGLRPGMAEYDRMLAAWLDDFALRGVDALGLGWVLARRPWSEASGAGRTERIGHAVGEEGLGAQVAAFFAAEDAPALHDDAVLLATALTTSPDVTEARHLVPGADDPSVIELRQGGGLRRTVEVDPALAALVGASDGELAVGALVAAIAELLEVDPADLRADLLPRVRDLIRTGFLRLP